MVEDVSKVLNLSREDTQRYAKAKLEIENQPKWFIEVAKLSAGQSFGELALINDAPRAATVYCLSECIFAVIERKDYEKVLKRIELKAQQAKIQFFSKIHLL